MVLLNQSTRELTAKVVYYGPGLCGKTSNLQFIYDTLDEGQRGKMLSLATDTDRTLFFDFMPMELGTVRGFKVRVQLYTVPGQVFYEETRKRVLKGADGVVFVADSQRTMRDANLESLGELKHHLRENGLDPDTIPTVLQYNKRDLRDIFTVEEMDSDLNPGNLPFFEAIAKEGVGVEDTLKCISKLVLKRVMSPPQESQAGRIMTQPTKAKPVPPPVVMDNRKLLSELGIAGMPTKAAKGPAAPPKPPPPPPPPPPPEEEVLLAETAEADADLLGSPSDNLLGMDESAADLLGGAEDLPLTAVESTNPDLGDVVRTPDALAPIELVEAGPEEEVVAFEDPPALAAVEPAAGPKSLDAVELPAAEAAGASALAVVPGGTAQVELRIGDRRYRLTVRLEEL